MLLLPKSLFILFRGKRVGLVSLFLSLIWRKLMIDLNGISSVRFLCSSSFLLVLSTLFLNVCLQPPFLF